MASIESTPQTTAQLGFWNGPRCLGLMAAAISLGALLGWIADLETLKRVLPSFIAMNPMTAVCITAIAFCLFLPDGSAAAKWRKRCVGAVVALVGASKIIDIVAGTDLGVDRYLFAGKLLGTDALSANAMAPSTALVLAALGAAVICFTATRHWAIILGQACAFIAVIVAMVAIYGYIFDISQLYDIDEQGSLVPMALHTAIASMMLAVALIWTKSDNGIFADASRQTEGAEPDTALSRRKLSLALAVLLIVLSAAFWGEHQNKVTYDWISRTYLVLTEAPKQRALLRDAESEVGGYLISGENGYRTAFKDLRPHLTEPLEKMDVLIRDNPSQQERLAQLAPLIAAQLNKLDDTISLAENGDYEAAVGLTKADVDGAAMSQISRIIADIEGEENQLLAQRQAAQLRISTAVRVAEGLGLLILATVAVLVYRQVNEASTAQRQARASQAQAVAAALAASQSKSNFLASMSHEIRTPMNGITAMADLLSQTNLDEDQGHMVRTIRESGNALIAIINDILDFSKIEAGKLNIENVSMSVADALEGVAGTLTPNAAKKSIRIHTFVHPAIPTVQGDPTRLRQILFNLGGNAVKFSNGKDVVMRAAPVDDGAARRDNDDNGQLKVRFEVIDQGIGISAENQGRLFQAFSQAESSTTRRFGGTGLGLAICKRLVDRLGGAIGIESIEGQGSTFWVELPFVPASARGNEKARDLSGLRVVVVAGMPRRTDAISAYVAHWGGEAVAATDIEATAMAAAAPGADPAATVYVIDQDLDEILQRRSIAMLRAVNPETPPRIVLLQDFQQRAARISDSGVVTVDANPLMRHRLITVIAVAASRASPEVRNDEDLVRLKPVRPPTVDEALAEGRLVLLAEDNPTNQDVIQRQLNLVGYTCECADNGVEALEAYKTGRYALLLTDCHMPEMDGYELTAAIRDLERGTGRRTPIIAVTANALQGEAERCLAAGMDDYVSKPIAMPALVAALKRWMPQPTPGAPVLQDVPPATAPHFPPTATAPGSSFAALPTARSSSAALPTAPVDDRAIKDMFGDDPDTFKEILVSFAEPSENIIDEILVGWKEHNADGVREAAHKLKSSARTIGANALADSCVALESAARTGDWITIDRLAPLSQTQLKDVIAYVGRL